MNLLNETSIKIAEQEVKHFESIIDTLGLPVDGDKIGEANHDHNKYNLEVRKDRLLVMKALLSIDIEFCEKKGIDIADLLRAINRLSK